jgi:hypothetical protein
MGEGLDFVLRIRKLRGFLGDRIRLGRSCFVRILFVWRVIVLGTLFGNHEHL